MKYDYLAALEADIKTWMVDNYFDISEYSDNEDAHEFLRDEIWSEDSVTGNGSDWYDSAEKCEEYLCGNWDLILSAIDNFCIDANDVIKTYKNKIPCFLDCLVRLDLLDAAIENVLEELESDKEDFS